MIALKRSCVHEMLHGIEIKRTSSWLGLDLAYATVRASAQLATAHAGFEKKR